MENDIMAHEVETAFCRDVSSVIGEVWLSNMQNKDPETMYDALRILIAGVGVTKPSNYQVPGKRKLKHPHSSRFSIPHFLLEELWCEYVTIYVHKGYKKSSGSCSASTSWAVALMVQGLNFTRSEGLLQHCHGWSPKVLRR